MRWILAGALIVSSLLLGRALPREGAGRPRIPDATVDPLPVAQQRAEPATTTAAPQESEPTDSGIPIAQTSGHVGVLSGRVEVSDRRRNLTLPLVGATVEIVPRLAQPSGTSVSDVEEHVSEQLARFRRSLQRSRSTRTDNDGEFTFEAVDADTTFDVTIAASGYETKFGTARCGRPAHFSLSASPSNPMEVIVRLDGQPVASAPTIEIAKFHGKSVRLRTVSCPDGRLVLRKGSHLLRATYLDQYASEFRRVEVTDKPSAPIVFDVTPALVLDCAIEHDFELLEGSVRVRSPGFAGNPKCEVVEASAEFGRSPTQLAFVGIAPGATEVSWLANSIAEAAIDESWPVTLRDGRNAITLHSRHVESPPNPGMVGTLEIREGDQPLTGIESLRTRAKSAGGSLGGLVDAEEVRPGVYNFTFPSKAVAILEGGTEGTLAIGVRLPKRGKFYTQWDLDQPRRPHQVVVPPLAVVSIEVPGYMGSYFAGRIVVRIESLSRSERYREHIGSWRRGPFDNCPDMYGCGRFEVAAEPHRIEATYRPAFHRQSEVSYWQREIDLQPGEHHVTVPLPEVVPVTLQPTSAYPRKKSNIWTSGRGSVWSGQIDDPLELLLPEGEYNWKIGREVTLFRVVEGRPTSIEFDPLPVEAMRITRIDAAEHALRVGDTIFEIDGERLRLEKHVFDKWKELRARTGKVTFGVWREGEIVSIDVEGGELVGVTVRGVLLPMGLERER